MFYDLLPLPKNKQSHFEIDCKRLQQFKVNESCVHFITTEFSALAVF